MRAAKYDVAVVGAGPAGSTVARRVAEHGASVILLDKACFPRPKACAGAVPPGALPFLPLDVDAGFGVPIHAAHLSYRLAAEVVCSSPTPLGWTVDRAEFDDLLAKRAVRAGAVFRDGRKTTGLRRVGGVWEIDVGDEALRATFVVGADGAASLVARCAGMGRPDMAVTIEAEVHVSAERWAEGSGRVRFDFGYAGSGYAWVFAKSNHFSVGIYSVRLVSGRVLRRRLKEFISRAPMLAGGRVSNVRCWFVPRAGGRRRDLHFDGGLLVGDAAGLADPLTGEGIRPALRSAELAAQSLVEVLGGGRAGLEGYSQSIDRVLRSGFRLARVCAAIVFRGGGRLVGGFVRSGFGEEAWGRLARAEESYPGLRWGLLALAAWLPFARSSRRTSKSESAGP